MDKVPEADRCACEPKVERDGKSYPPMANQPASLIGKAATAVLWTRGKRAAWSAEGVVEEPLEEKKTKR